MPAGQPLRLLEQSTVRSVGKGRWEGREGIDGADRKDMKDAEDISPKITTKMSLKYSIFLDVIWLTSFTVLLRGPSTNTSWKQLCYDRVPGQC